MKGEWNWWDQGERKKSKTTWEGGNQSMRRRGQRFAKTCHRITQGLLKTMRDGKLKRKKRRTV